MPAEGVAAIIFGMHMPVRQHVADSLENEDRFSAIRCPHCRWQPAASSRWCCDARNTPEPYFDGCHTTWNTFTTRGKCPGCAHQWRWTLCLQCDGWSLHEHWYEKGSTP